MARVQVLNYGLELKRRQLELQHDPAQLNLRAKTSEVEAEERVYQLCEERKSWSNDISPLKSSVKKSPPNPNVAGWSACALSGKKNAVPSMQDRGATVKEEKESCSAEEVRVNVKLEEQNPSLDKVQNVGSSDTLPDETCLLQIINIMQLPKAEIMTFSGNPLEFWMFMRSFDNSIGSATLDDSAKLNRLFQYCKGEALKVIKCCAVTSPSEGYARARVLLKERFGDDYKISEVWVRKVTEGPVDSLTVCSRFRAMSPGEKLSNAYQPCSVRWNRLLMEDR